MISHFYLVKINNSSTKDYTRLEGCKNTVCILLLLCAVVNCSFNVTGNAIDKESTVDNEARTTCGMFPGGSMATFAFADDNNPGS